MMAGITMNARFDNLDDAEQAATELRSLFGTHVDIRALSGNQSSRSSDPPGDSSMFALPGLNFGSPTPFAAVFPSTLPGEDVESGVYSDHAYVVEAQVSAEQEQLAAEIIERYGAERI